MPARAKDYLHRFGMEETNVDPAKISRFLGIKVITYREAADLFDVLGFSKITENNDGFAVNIQNRPAIFYDDSRSPERQRATIAHELGHFVNGDLERPRAPCAGRCCDKCREWQADSFAFNLLFPDNQPKDEERSNP